MATKNSLIGWTHGAVHRQQPANPSPRRACDADARAGPDEATGRLGRATRAPRGRVAKAARPFRFGQRDNRGKAAARFRAWLRLHLQNRKEALFQEAERI